MFQVWTTLIQKSDSFLHSPTNKWMCHMPGTSCPREDYGQVRKMDCNKIITKTCDEDHSGRVQVFMKGCNIGSQETSPKEMMFEQELKDAPELNT